MSLCTATQEALLEALRQEGELSSELRTHVQQCPTCTRAESELRGMIAAARTAMQVELPAALQQRTLARLREPMAAAARGRHRLRWLGLAAGLCGVLGVALFVVVRPAGQGLPPRLVSGEVEVVGADKASAGAVLHRHDVVRVAPGGRAVIAASGAELELTDGAEAALGEAGAALALRRGVVVAKVTPRQHNAPFTLRAGRALVTVTGTLFRVTRAPEAVSVTVARGSVQVSAGSETVVLHDGEAVRVPLTGRFEGRVPSPAEIETLLSRDQASPTPAPSASREPTDGTIAPRAGAPTDHGLTPAVGRVERQRPTNLVRADPPVSASIERLLKTGDCAGAATLFDKQGNAASGLAIASCYQAAANPKDALRVLQSSGKRFGGTPSGEEALFETGRLAQELGEHGDAVQAFADYLQRSPAGPVAPEALFRRCTSLLELRRFDEAARCAANYQVRFSWARQVKDAMLLEANVRREHLHDCASALVLYNRYLSLSSTQSEEVRRWRDVCAAEAH